MKTEQIARVAHETNRTYCQSIGDDSQPSWEDAPDWQKESAQAGVKFHSENPDAKPEDSHNSWLAEKKKDGWQYGPEKDPENKLHPCFVPYEDLPIEQQKKDSLFIGVVRALLVALFALSLPALAFADEAVSQVPWAEIIPVVGTVLALLITWGGKLLRELIKSKVKNETLNGILYRAEKEAEELVLYAEQSLRPSFQKKLADGKLDYAEKEDLKAEVLAIFKDSLAWGDLVSIAFGGNESEATLKADRMIEASVQKLKIAGGPSVDPTVGSPEA